MRESTISHLTNNAYPYKLATHLVIIAKANNAANNLQHTFPFSSSIAATNTANASNPIITNNEIKIMFFIMVIMFMINN